VSRACASDALFSRTCASTSLRSSKGIEPAVTASSRFLASVSSAERRWMAVWSCACSSVRLAERRDPLPGATDVRRTVPHAGAGRLIQVGAETSHFGQREGDSLRPRPARGESRRRPSASTRQ
jgi:hypothetical protein